MLFAAVPLVCAVTKAKSWLFAFPVLASMAFYIDAELWGH
jgi:hypothetical protein